MKSYERYREVNLPWVKYIPAHWELSPVRQIFEERKEKNIGSKNKFILSVLKNRGVIPYAEKGNIGNKASENIENYKVVYPDDIVLNSMNMMIGSLGKSEYKGVLSQVYYVLKLYDNSYNYIDYFSYVFRNKCFYETFKMLGKGILDHRLRVPLQVLKYENLPIPPLNEQKQIANYLDWKINEIERLILNEKEKIKNLEKVLSAYIDSKYQNINLNLDKVDGVKLKFLANKITRRNFELRPYIALENVSPRRGRLKGSFSELEFQKEGIATEKGMVIFGKLRPYLAKTVVVESKAVCSSEFIVLEPVKVTSEYLKYLMLTSGFIELVNGSTYGTKMPRANSDFIMNLKINIPNLNEQNQIVEDISACEIQLDKVKKIILDKIESLLELKESIISEVVSGQIDVRNIFIPDYETVLMQEESDESDELEDIEDGD